VASLPDLTWDKASTVWATILNKFISNPLVNGVQLKEISLIMGSNTINHKLGRKPQGYLVTAMYDAYADIYNEPSPTPIKSIVLNASAPTVVDIYVY
jgi:hypothetical protein